MRSKQKNKPSKFWRWWSHLFDKWFWLIPVVSFFASLWFPLISKVIGAKFGLIDDSQAFTTAGIIASVVIMGIPVALTIMKVISEKIFDDRKELETALDDEKRHNDLFLRIINSFDQLCENKEQKIVRAMQTPSDKTKGYDPHEQLEYILNEIDNNVSFLLSDSGNRIKSNDLYVSLYYSFDNGEEWHCANTRQKGMSTADLLTQNTTFKYLLNEKSSNYVFYNSKESAKADHKYVPDKLDRYENDELVGSIAGYKFSITSDEKTYVDAILFLTTYGKKFVDIDERKENIPYIENAKANIEQFILEKYIKRIKIEFGSWYLNTHS